MIITETKYSPSINIIRDERINREYIVTPNSSIAYHQIIKNSKLGFKAFNLIGAYGTGKSSFLLAFEKNLRNESIVFSKDTNLLNGINKFEFYKIIGEFDSFIKTFKNCFSIRENNNSVKKILSEFKQVCLKLKKSNTGLIIIVDEFGKFLEYATKYNPELEIYFIQQLCELINDEQLNAIFITSLHQDLSTYSMTLDNGAQKNEWQKVKGRFKEITFNEPVEQLLLLAAERLTKINPSITKPKNFKQLFDLISKSDVFPLNDFLQERIAYKLLPFDILSASILTLCLQKYAQNERSLFTFIESDDPYALKDINESVSYYSVSNVYDYIYHNYQYFINSKYNPHFPNWATIRDCINRLNGYEGQKNDSIKLIKTIGLLNVFSVSNISYDFLVGYSKLSLSIKNPEKNIDALEKAKIIKYSSYNNKYTLFEGTDLNIELAINEAGKIVPRINNVVNYLKNIFEFENILAKSIYYELGTPRVFKFELTDSPKITVPQNEVDGYINLVFSDKISEKDLILFSGRCDEAILFAHYKNTKSIADLIYDIEKVKKVQSDNQHDRIAYRELSAIILHQENLLKHYVVENLYSKNSLVDWYFKGKKVKIINRKYLNKKLSEICKNVYSKTPKYHNELVNKTKISGTISTARNNLLKSILNSYSRKDLGFDELKFPPEKTIYLSLLKKTGIHTFKSKNEFDFGEPSDPSFIFVWKEFLLFIQNSKRRKKSLFELINILQQKPYKLKKGLIDFLIPIFLFIKRDDIAIYLDNSYLPELNSDIFELIFKSPNKFEIKAFDINGVKLEIFNKCREYLNQQYQEGITNSSFIETIKPFLIFYRQLPEYSKQTIRLSVKTKQFREVVKNSKDPEKVFFEQLPSALGFNFNGQKHSRQEVEQFIDALKSSIKELRSSYDNLIERIYEYLCNLLFNQILNFKDFHANLVERYGTIKEPLLLNHQKSFYYRMNSDINDLNAWVSSVAQVLINKPLDQITDNDESILYEKFKEMFYDLDNLCEISKMGVNLEKEEIMKIDVQRANSPLISNLIRYPKTKEGDIVVLKNKIEKVLSKDSTVNKIALLKLFNELN